MNIVLMEQEERKYAREFAAVLQTVTDFRDFKEIKTKWEYSKPEKCPPEANGYDPFWEQTGIRLFARIELPGSFAQIYVVADIDLTKTPHPCEWRVRAYEGRDDITGGIVNTLWGGAQEDFYDAVEELRGVFRETYVQLGLLKNDFQKTIQGYLEEADNPRELADKLDVAVFTLKRWADGSVIPHKSVREHALRNLR